jgi:uncharacterized protein
MDVISNWHKVKSLFKSAFSSSFHFAVATVNENGEPHVTPIGSLILGKPGHGIYFEKFSKNMPRNLNSNEKICVLAVNSSKWFWLKSLILGRFKNPPAVRLYGVAGDLREATQTEIALWQKRVKRLSFSKGHALLWRSMSMVRDVEFTRIEPVHFSEMTRYTWGTNPYTENT